MSDASFHSVLLKKIEDLYAQTDVESSDQTPTSPRKPPRAAIDDLHFTHFVKHAVFPKTQFVRSYPVKVQKVSVPLPQTTPIVLTAKKKNLSEEAQSKWNLFEKTFKKSLGPETTRSAILKTFRAHIKSVHPDLNVQAESYNFSHFVKVKDELVAVIEDHLRKN